MKRKGNLFENIISIENLQLADSKAQKGKKYQKGIRRHNKKRELNILNLHISLKEEKYKTSKYSIFPIYEPKKRIISVLEYYPNRIVHWAIINYLQNIFTNCFISQTCSCIKFRGIHKALKILAKYLREEKGTTYCLKIDIKKFYPSVNKQILKKKLRTKLKDRKLLNLLDEIIDSNEQGLPLGNLLSSWFANFYLNDFDHWIKENKRIKYYLRYSDDCIILGNDKEKLHSLRREIQIYLKEIGLRLSNYQVFPVSARGIDFLGYRSFHKYRLIRNSIKKRFKRMMRKYRNTKSIASYKGWLIHANTINLQNKYF